jgi:hypothetical protein
MAIFYSPEGNPEVWDEKPAGYFTEQEWEVNDRPAAILRLLTALDALYLPPRVLAGLALGDDYAKEQWERHEAEAEPLREALAALEAEEKTNERL